MPPVTCHLPVNVAHYGDGGVDMDDIALEHQDLLGLFANLAQEGLVQELLAQELLDARVEVKTHDNWGYDK